MSISVQKQFELTGHSTGIYTVGPGRSPHTIFTGSGDNIVAEWDLIEQKVLPFAIKLDSTVYALANLPENQLAIGQGKGGIHIIDLQSRKELRHLAVHQKAIFDLRYLPRHNQLLAFSADGSLSVWAAGSFDLIRHIPVADLKMRRASVSHDGNWLVTSGNDGRLRVFDTEMYNEIYTFEAHEKSSNISVFTPDNRQLISGGWDGHLRVWDAHNGYKLLKEIAAHNYAVYDVVFSPGGEYLATASRDKTVKIWDSETLKPLARLDVKSGGHSHSVNALHWNAETGLLVSVGDDRKVVGWGF